MAGRVRGVGTRRSVALLLTATVLTAALLASCTGDGGEGGVAAPAATTTPSTPATEQPAELPSSPATEPAPSPSTEPTELADRTGPPGSTGPGPAPSGPGPDPPGPTPGPDVDLGGPGVRPDAMLATVRLLAGRIGPREATSAAFGRAADAVQRTLRAYGYAVDRQRFRLPAGDSWGVPVDAGRSSNVIATPPGFDPARPHRVVGAHLDTVAVAPGAEDNASGVAVLLELARLSARLRGPGPALQTAFVAYGGEEPRGEGDDLHHFGSTAHVQRMPAAQRSALEAMISLDRVGVGGSVPVCTGGLSPLRVRDDLLRLAGRLGLPATGCTDNTSSDHWSYEKAGVTVARLGSTPYAAYHSEADRPGVVQRAQLRRVAELAWAWVRG